MSIEHLYDEVNCAECGKTKLKLASFCPHCGYVEPTSLGEYFDASFKRSQSTSNSVSVSNNRWLSLLEAIVVIAAIAGASQWVTTTRSIIVVTMIVLTGVALLRKLREKESLEESQQDKEAI